MGIHVIKMPDIGEGIAEVELVMWHVQPGDEVAEDQILADVMTDKATIEIPSPVVGKVITLGGKAGELMAVGSELIRIEVEGKGNLGASASATSTAAAKTPAVLPSPAGGRGAGGEGARQDKKVDSPKSSSVSLESIPPTQASSPQPSPASGRGGKNTAASISATRAPGEKPIASPALRRRAWDLGIELRYVQGSGAAGRIMQEDLDAFIARSANPQAESGAGRRYVERHDEEALPIIGLRRKIAQKMQEAKRRIPHFTYVEEIDMTELEALRKRVNQQWGDERGRLTILPLLMRAVVLAVREFPQINARFDDDAGVVTRYGAVHIGIATQTDGGLMVPVLRHAEARDLWSCATEVTRLAEAARSGKVLREELSGSTITITSLGALGGIVSTPVINHPEVAIVGVNRMVLRPMIRDGAVVPRQMMNLSSSFDHRVVDGVDAAEFIQAVRGYLEFPATLFVE